MQTTQTQQRPRKPPGQTTQTRTLVGVTVHLQGLGWLSGLEPPLVDRAQSRSVVKMFLLWTAVGRFVKEDII